MKHLLLALVLAAGCGGPARTTYARHPGSALMFDRTTASEETLTMADKVLAAHGGAAAWEAAKQIRWKQTVTLDGKQTSSVEQAWDRWNARHWAQLEREKGGAFAVMYDIYGSYASGYIQGRSGGKQVVPTGEAAEGVKVARRAWQRDATVTLAPFLMFEPGAKLEYKGIAKDGDLELHEIQVTFDPKDAAREGLELHLYCDKDTFLVKRIALGQSGGEKSVYELLSYKAFGGLQISTERKNLGSGETVIISDVQVGSPDDDLYIAPVS
ncbi:MAG: hypothetical protein JNL83_04115 [Myxococcales bacterium]|nr:hypothetical protein [Myxococcales bacterium]